MRVLVFGVEKWLGIARVPQLLRDAGFAVATLSPPGTFLGATRQTDERFALPAVDGPHILSAIGGAVDDWGAEFIVPGDESVLSMLHQIVRASEAGTATGLSDAAIDVVRRSLPPSAFFEATTHKQAFARLCRELGIRVPERRSVCTMADLLSFAEESGYPVVVRTDESVAGAGVHICSDEDALAKAGYATLPQFTSHGRRTEVNPVSVETFVEGEIGHLAVAAYEGETAALSASVKHRCNPERSGPASVLRFVDPGEAGEFATLFLAHTHFTGLAAFDCIVDAEGRCTFLECNARPVAATAACKHVGVDLGAALYAALTGGRRPRFFLDEGAMVALYPQEVIRDPESEFLKSAIHDVPVNDPELVAAYEAHVVERRARLEAKN